MSRTIIAILGIAAGAAVSTGASALERELPELVRQPTPEAVVQEHQDALNVCDWDRIMAQYPEDAEIHLPRGEVVIGREAIGELFEGFCRPVAEGGLEGILFSTEHVFPVGGTLNLQWVGEAEFLAEPYRGSDAYVTRDGLMAAMVTTFDGTELKLKE